LDLQANDDLKVKNKGFVHEFTHTVLYGMIDPNPYTRYTPTEAYLHMKRLLYKHKMHHIHKSVDDNYTFLPSAHLKDMLKKHNLSVHGKKSKLVERIITKTVVFM
jgi:hypothetical protein